MTGWIALHVFCEVGDAQVSASAATEAGALDLGGG
jgi:hypothetical protein